MLREQIITPRAGRPSSNAQTGKGRGSSSSSNGVAAGTVQQRPVARRNKNQSSARSNGARRNLRGVLVYLPLIFKSRSPSLSVC